MEKIENCLFEYPSYLEQCSIPSLFYLRALSCGVTRRVFKLIIILLLKKNADYLQIIKLLLVLMLSVLMAELQENYLSNRHSLFFIFFFYFTTLAVHIVFSLNSRRDISVQTVLPRKAYAFKSESTL